MRWLPRRKFRWRRRRAYCEVVEGQFVWGVQTCSTLTHWEYLEPCMLEWVAICTDHKKGMRHG